MEFVEVDPAEVPDTTALPVLPEQVAQAAQDRVACLERDYLLYQRADAPVELLDRLEGEHQEAVQILTVVQKAAAGVSLAPPDRLVSGTTKGKGKSA